MTWKTILLLTAAFAFVGALTPVAAQDSPSASQNARGQTAPTYVEPLDAKTLNEVQALYKRLIDAEDIKDLDTVREMVWKSPSALFVAKTATAAEGNWAGFWGDQVVVQHIHDISQGPFRIEPDYARVRPSVSHTTWPKLMRRCTSPSVMPDRLQFPNRS
jgi:hypothetical protein